MWRPLSGTTNLGHDNSLLFVLASYNNKKIQTNFSWFLRSNVSVESVDSVLWRLQGDLSGCSALMYSTLEHSRHP
jgi:hypothetical protein